MELARCRQHARNALVEIEKTKKKRQKEKSALCCFRRPEGIGRTIAEGAGIVKLKAVLLKFLTKSLSPLPFIPSAAGACQYLIRDGRKPYWS